jgi:hypothetical protein
VAFSTSLTQIIQIGMITMAAIYALASATSFLFSVGTIVKLMQMRKSGRLTSSVWREIRLFRTYIFTACVLNYSWSPPKRLSSTIDEKKFAFVALEQVISQIDNRLRFSALGNDAGAANVLCSHVHMPPSHAQGYQPRQSVLLHCRIRRWRCLHPAWAFVSYHTKVPWICSVLT